MDQVAFELDHFFIFTDINAPAADRLVSFGLTEGTSNDHPGQGTACRRFFFHNCMLELLWVHNPEEAQSVRTRPTHLWERWHDRGNCPFGICLRPATHSSQAIPFSTWAYHPAYLPDSLSIAVGMNNTVLTEPWLFYSSFGKRQDTYPEQQRQPLKHPAGLTEITRVTIAIPDANLLSPELQAIVNHNLIQLHQGEPYQLELGFDGETQGACVDFQPELPLKFYW